MASPLETHASSHADAGIEGSTNRTFGFVFAGFFAILAGLRWWSGAKDPTVFAGVSAAFAVVAITAPGVLAPLNRLWMRLGLLLNRVVSPIVLGIIFFSTVTPIGIIMRLLGKDPLRLRLDPEADSYWIPRQPPGPPPPSMRQQF